MVLKFIAGGVAGFAGRRALFPVVAVGTAFSSAAWFGTFELCFSFTKLFMPVPAKQDENARLMGALSIPAVLGAAGGVGWMFAPAVEAAPAKATDAAGWAKLAQSLPIKHWAMVGAGSAAAAAVTCRAVQYRCGG
mmetsp:Transcript_73258/g.201178  ORF Transcript_73258/g.201178 Transcript_73258/m.201178 type:complete len:135 (+) Transcript_73258:37-441(+)